MDLSQAHTFLAIVETGSFKAAGERLNITQSAVSIRIKTLEDVIGRRLFERTKAGATLTPAGHQLERHAAAMIRLWRHAQLDMAMTADESRHVAIGGQTSLWEGFLLKWISTLRRRHPDIAMTTTMATAKALTDRVLEGTLDLAVCYRGESRPGIVVDHLFDEELVLVKSGVAPSTKSAPNQARPSDAILKPEPYSDYVFVNWGPEFAADHAAAYPGRLRNALNIDLGAIGINYVLDNPAAGYFPQRIAQPHLAAGTLALVPGARRFIYPVFLLTPEERPAADGRDLIASLRTFAKSFYANDAMTT